MAAVDQVGERQAMLRRRYLRWWLAAPATCLLSFLFLWLPAFVAGDAGVACGGPLSLSPSEMKSGLERKWERLREPVTSTFEQVLVFNALPSVSALLSGAFAARAGRRLSTAVGALAVSVMLVVALDWMYLALGYYRLLNCAGWDGELPWLLWHLLPVLGYSSAAVLLAVGVVARWRSPRSGGSGPVRYDEVIGPLRTAYDDGARQRDVMGKAPWKLAEREAFLKRLNGHGCRRLLEVGAGSGQDSAYFQENGLEVVAVDLSPAMVALCREKGIEAYVMDFLGLDFAAGSFDAVYALNCLLHVPNRDLAAVLDAIHALMRPGGLFFLGVYGLADTTEEGPFEGDDHYPPRFFSFRSDERLQEYARKAFEIVDFHVVEAGGHRFQSLTLQRAV
ncbi:hypothetical protein GCM10022224_072520 [Nonomuraea antimicrobica]|uniref:Methyltransferase domain-containing protein n=1 Tax=Nonomuraea antimicrobica TaxID=561173 RepID=A0ABP7CXU5_9ACTN